MSTKAVFLDRDGVLNKTILCNNRPHPPRTPAELEILGGVETACRQLKSAGFLLICVTNQPDIARGTADEGTVRALNDTIRDLLDLDDFRVCPHDDGDDCPCRKPRPGMVLDAANDFDIDLSSSTMVGDRWKDIDAGLAAGCRTVFIDHHYDEPQPVGAHFVCRGLIDAVPWITGNMTR